MPKKIQITEAQIKSILDHVVSEQMSLNELIKFGEHTYSRIKTPDGVVFVSHEGILGDDHTFISWQLIEELMTKFYK